MLDALPKVELHLHLDCSLSYEVAARLRPGLNPAEYQGEFAAPPRCNNLVDYIRRAQAGIALMQTEESLRAVTLDLFEQLAKDNVIYAEIRFAPLLHTADGLSPEEVVSAVDAALAEGIAASGIEARLILCTLRHFSEKQSMATVQLVERFRGTRVVGFDIAADEAGYPVTAHRSAFHYAIEHGIHRTAHAGEACGPHSVWETLREFQPARIGHGVRSIEDPDLVAHLKESRIHLEVCPTSNVQTGAASSLPQHPIDRLYRAGVSLSVNCDGRTISQITLAQEYSRLKDAFKWSKAEFLNCNLEAVRAAFIPEELREKLERRLENDHPTASDE
jgi:adenosine deaminase